MKFFIDTAKVEDIKAANDMGIICGVTTNPSLIAKEGRDFNEVINEITEIFMMHDIQTEIIAASIRNPIHVIDCAKAGADIATCPFKVLEAALHHPLTDAGIARFKADWEKSGLKE